MHTVNIDIQLSTESFGSRVALTDNGPGMQIKPTPIRNAEKERSSKHED